MVRTALVTGGNRGIGFAIAKGLAAQGIQVLLGCRDLQAGQTQADKIKAVALPLDLSDREILRKQGQDILADFPQIDILVNNAGILENGTLLTVSQAQLYQSMRIHFEAPYELMQMLVPQMKKRGYGRVVNISSGWGSFADGLNGPAAYSVSKAALNALTLSFSQAVPQSVKINAMCPGWVRTRMGGMMATRSPAKGAKTALWLANLPDDGPTGGFFRDQQPIDW